MTQREQTRLQVLNSLMADHMTTEQAATLMGVSARHTRRILAAYRRDGAAALAHGNRGRRPANATSDPLATDVVVLARTRYAGVNHTHLSELLREREGIDIGRNTLRKILTDAGMNSPRRRRPPKHRVRRQRMTREGMLIQIDGSYHRWLGEDGPQFTLLLAVDDATGCVVNALFCEQENTRSYLLLMRDLIRSYGIPLALYSDRHGVFKHTPPSETAAAPTQFSRAMGEIGVQLIFARSPQAKGRVERTAGTLQDRLVTELRLAGATTIDDANRVLDDFLPRFNERFRVPPECYCSAIPSALTVKRKCPHHGECDIDAERADEASGSQQFDGGPYDLRAGSDFDGSERAPHQAYSGGLQKGRCSRTRSRQPRSQTSQRYTGPVGVRRGASGADPIRGSQPHAPE